MNVITKNNISNNHDVGIYLEKCNFTIISENVILGNYRCFREEECIGTVYENNEDDCGDKAQISSYNPFLLIIVLIGVYIAINIKLRKFKFKYLD